jgi:hypothetical protein
MSSTPCSLAVHALILCVSPPRMVRPMYSYEGIRGYIPHRALLSFGGVAAQDDAGRRASPLPSRVGLGEAAWPTAAAPARGPGRHRVVATATGFSSSSSPSVIPFPPRMVAPTGLAWAGGSGALVARSDAPRSGGGAGGVGHGGGGCVGLGHRVLRLRGQIRGPLGWGQRPVAGHSRPVAAGGGWQCWPQVPRLATTTGNGFGARQCDARGKVKPGSVCPVGGGGG